MRRHLRCITICAIGLGVLLLASCGEPGTVPVALSFEDSGGARAMSSARAITLTPDESLEALIDFYDPSVSNIGTLVGSYTPSKFRLFVQEIVLYNDTDAIELDVPLSASSATDQSPHYADFVEDIVIQPSNPVPSGAYTGMFFFFFSAPSTMGVNGTPENPDYLVPVDSQIEVTIPGYEGVWPDVDNHAGPIVEDLGSGAYRFALFPLQPGYWTDVVESYRPGESIERIEKFIYMQDTTYRAILPGISGHPDIWDTTDADTAALPNHGSTGNASAVFMPFGGVDIPSSAKAVEFTVSWDLDGIIEVYDAGTAADKSDDIVVLAKDFWNRFTLIPNVIE
ncbi:MAG: hypothetical protein ACLFNT_10505 [Spirochaetales bacterium]